MDSLTDKIEILCNDKNSLVLCIKDEDHTIGNLLRYIIMKNEDVEFCGYSVPHPSENLLNLRIQAPEPMKAFVKGLDDLVDLFECVKEKFEKAKE
jgi:DNA-directed RNA polymerase I and III subunit RPAC2